MSDDPIWDEILNQDIEWIKYAQQSQRDLAERYNETAKTLLGLFSTVFGFFTIVLTFFGIPNLPRVPAFLIILPIGMFGLSMVFLIWVIGPQRQAGDGRESFNYSNPDEIMELTVTRNITDHKYLTYGILFFILAILLIPFIVGYSMTIPEEQIQALVVEEKVPHLRSLSVPFEGNSSLTSEVFLVKRDDKTTILRLASGDRIYLNNDWIQAIIFTG